MKTLVLCLCLVLAACASYDGYNLRPGASTAAEVRSVMGAPAMEFKQADGATQLVYPRGPLGTQTFMVIVGPDGVLRAIEKALGEGTFNRIQPGMTRDEVLRLIGPPSESMHFARSDTTAWDYRFNDIWGYLAYFSVVFDRDGVVVSKFTRRVERDKGR